MKDVDMNTAVERERERLDDLPVGDVLERLPRKGDLYRRLDEVLDDIATKTVEDELDSYYEYLAENRMRRHL